MIEVHPLLSIDLTSLKRVVSGYTSPNKYEVIHTASDSRVIFDLQLTPVAEPYQGRYDHFDEETLQRYTSALAEGYSFGAYDADLLAGLIIAEPHHWNNSIWVHEFHVAETHRNRGLGKQLMTTLAEKAQREGFRIIVCETQNTNVPAIQVYLKLGFKAEGVDISYYTNEDYPAGQVAVFMKRRLK